MASLGVAGLVMANTVIRDLRLGREWTQEQVAGLAAGHVERATGRRPALDANWVSRLERGIISWPAKDYRQALRKTFGVAADSDLGLFPKRTRRARISEGVDQAKRRDFLSLSIAAGLLPAPVKRLGTSDVNALSERIYAIEEWDRRSGGGHARHLALVELRYAQNMSAASAAPGVRSRLCSVVANLCDLGGWSSLDCGQTKDARALFGVGIEAAREAGDDGMVCHVASGLARQLAEQGQARDALAALDMVDPARVPVSARSMLAVVRAQALALQGDERRVGQNIRAAESAYAQVTDLAGEPRWMWYFTGHKLNGDIGDALFTLSTVNGRAAGELVERLRQGADSLDARRARSKSIYAAKLAAVLYRQKDRDEASHYEQVAEGLSATVRSARLERALSEVRKAKG